MKSSSPVERLEITDSRLRKSQNGRIYYCPLVSSIALYVRNPGIWYATDLPSTSQGCYKLLKKGPRVLFINSNPLPYRIWKIMSERRIVPVFNLTACIQKILAKKWRELAKLRAHYRLIRRFCKPVFVISGQVPVAVDKLAQYILGD